MSGREPVIENQLKLAGMDEALRPEDKSPLCGIAVHGRKTLQTSKFLFITPNPYSRVGARYPMSNPWGRAVNPPGPRSRCDAVPLPLV